MSRVLSWTSPTGTRKTIVVGGQRRSPYRSTYRASLETLESFVAEQRARVAQRVHEWYIGRTMDYMT